MKLEKEQKTQFVILCVLLAVVFGFGAYRMMGTGTSASSPTAAPAANAGKPAAPKAAATPAEEPTPAQDLAKAIGFVVPVKDPFTPQMAPETGCPALANTPPPPVRRMPPLVAQESGMPLPVMPSFESAPMNTGPAPVVQQLDPSKDYRLTGVIEGDSNVAIIRGPEDSRHIIREGQSLDGKYIVRSISRAGVRLSANGRSFFLTLSPAKGA